jgi:hypothetical protein
MARHEMACHAFEWVGCYRPAIGALAWTVRTETHRVALAEFRKQVGERQPKLAVETGLMALDGKVEMLG